MSGQVGFSECEMLDFFSTEQEHGCSRIEHQPILMFHDVWSQQNTSTCTDECSFLYYNLEKLLNVSMTITNVLLHIIQDP